MKHPVVEASGIIEIMQCDTIQETRKETIWLYYTSVQ